jgi:hypothetical protein
VDCTNLHSNGVHSRVIIIALLARCGVSDPLLLLPSPQTRSLCTNNFEQMEGVKERVADNSSVFYSVFHGREMPDMQSMPTQHEQKRRLCSLCAFLTVVRLLDFLFSRLWMRSTASGIS